MTVSTGDDPAAADLPGGRGDRDSIRVRALFLSDTHLGTRDCQATRLLDLLDRCDTPRIYLVGDIVDGWRLKARWYWPRSHDDIVRCLLAKQESGTRILYIPGNHDEFLRHSVGLRLGGVEVVDHAVHVGADGRRHLVIHGDQFDAMVTQMRRLARLGIWVYAAAVLAHDGIERWRRQAAAGTRRSALGERRVAAFERLAVAEARRRQFDGVVCGHVHVAASHEVQGIHYANTGDWVDSCTALVEHADGRLETLYWPGAATAARSTPAVTAPDLVPDLAASHPS
jgi:UDP-2,3-diacylglucosamine pyrophosphatase LpxH